MDDNIKIYTPEKVKLKEATVVLTKLGQGDLISGVKISEGQQTFRLEKEFENDARHDEMHSDKHTEVNAGSYESGRYRDAIQRKKSVFSVPSPKGPINVFSSSRSNEDKSEQKFTLVCNEETNNLTSSDLVRTDNCLGIRKDMKLKNSPFKIKSPSKHSTANKEPGFRSTSVPIITENTKGSFNLKQNSSSVDTILLRQSSADMLTKDKAPPKITPTKSFITDMVTAPHTSLKQVSQSIGREKSSIAKSNLVRLKDNGNSTKEIESNNHESPKSKNTLQKISVIGCSAYKTENNEDCPSSQKGKGANKTISKDTLTTDDEKMFTTIGIKNERGERFFIPTMKSNLDNQVPQSTTERQRTIPSILARSRSKIKAPTVRELLQREKSQAKLKNTKSSTKCSDASFPDIPYLNTGKSKVLPTTIPPKRASTSMSVIGKSKEREILDTTEETRNKKDSLLNDKPLTKRYKNTRYSIPFSGPSMVIPKNYDPNMPYSFSSILSSFSSSMYCKNDSNTPFLPKLSNDKKHTKISVKRDLDVSFLKNINNEHDSESTVTSPTSLPTRDQSSDTCEILSPSPCFNQYVKLEQPDRTLFTSPVKQMMTGYEKLPELQVRGTNQLISSPLGSNSMAKIETAGQEHCIITQFSSPNENCTPQIVGDRQQKSRVKKSKFVDIPVYHHPVVGNIHNQRNEAPVIMEHPNQIFETPNGPVENSHEPLCPAPSNASITCTAGNQINNDCNGCFYCDIEKILQNIDNAAVINVNDHAYTKSTHPSLNQSPMKEVRNEAKASDFHTLWSNAGGSNMQVLTVKCGEHMILIPNEKYPVSSGSGKIGSKQNDKQSGKTPRGNRDSIIGNRKKRIMKKKHNYDKETSRKLEFVKIVNLSQTKTCKQKQSNLEKVITCLKKQVIGNKDVQSNRSGNYYIANTIQIERSTDDVFTHVNNKVCVTFYNGEDVNLRRWHDYEDYHVRLTYDNVSGAISHIECDTLKSGFYVITKTGMQTKPPPENQTQTMATLISAIPSALTILNDSFFIAVGQLQCSSFPFPVQLPANIQKHTNLDYLMSSLASITTVIERPPYFSDRSYLPKADAGAWYSGKYYDVFTRQYHNKRGAMTGFEKSELNKKIYSNNNH